MDRRFLVVISDMDPVAVRVSAEWGTLAVADGHVDGAPLRRLGPHISVLRRPGPHVHDERLDLRLPEAVRSDRPTLIFPSIHRSRDNVPCLAAHPLGNLGDRAELGGRPRTVCPTDPPAMTSTLRRLAELGEPGGWTTTFESTHHGPELGLPAFFAEVGFGTLGAPPDDAVKALASALRDLSIESGDRVALAVGGGHYAPHFTELALRRRWAFGHIVSRHDLDSLDPVTASAAYALTPGAEGILYSRAQDSAHPALAGLAPRLRDGAAELRPTGAATDRSRSDARLSGT